MPFLRVNYKPCTRVGKRKKSLLSITLSYSGIGRQPATEMKRERNRGAQHGREVRSASPRPR